MKQSCKSPTAVYLSSDFYVILLLCSWILFLVFKDLEKQESVEAEAF